MRSYGLHISFLKTVIQLDIYPPLPLAAPPPPRDCFAGHGTCSCGRCVCDRGWFGTLCQHPRKCNMTEEQSKSLCESADGILCSGKGEYLLPELGLGPCSDTWSVQRHVQPFTRLRFAGMKTTLACTRLQTWKVTAGSLGSKKMKRVGRFSCKKGLSRLYISSLLSDTELIIA